MSDHRDLVIADLVDSETALAGSCAGLRETLRVALDLLHEQHAEIGKLQDRYRALCEEYRAHRARMIEAAARGGRAA